jgi:hypothetical protein
MPDPGHDFSIGGFMTITVFIRHKLDPFRGAQFGDYARAWLSIIPRCGGDLVGYWTPYEGANDIAYGLISFENLAACERLPRTAAGGSRGRCEFPFCGRRTLQPRRATDILAPRDAVIAVMRQAGDIILPRGRAEFRRRPKFRFPDSRLEE